MIRRRSIRARNQHRRINQAFQLQLTSMLDVMTILLIFILKSHAASTSSFTGASDLQLPFSDSQQIPEDAHHLVVSRKSISFEEEKILDYKRVVNQGSRLLIYLDPNQLSADTTTILPLYDALMKARKKTEDLFARSNTRNEDGSPLPFRGILAIQADRQIDYNVLRKILFTAGSAGYQTFRFLAMRHQE